MMKRKSVGPEPAKSTASIEPSVFYSVQEVAALTDITTAEILAATEARRIMSHRDSDGVRYRGRWVLKWLERREQMARKVAGGHDG